jgi:hypothetical protein
MKRFSTLLIFLLFIGNFFAPLPCFAQHERDGVTDMPYNGNIADNGDNTLGQVYNNTLCGLNYVIATKMITQRYTGPPTGSGLPSVLNMSMPPCVGANGANVLKAYIWWGVSYNTGSSTTPTITVTNPVSGVFSYTGTLVGSSGSKCWGEIGTRTFRADVTTCINTSGNYSINITGIPASEIDGATFVIIYRNTSASYVGTMIINDGCQTFSNGTPSSMTVNGFTACANSANGSGFSVTGDQQNNIAPPNHTTAINSVTQTFTNDFWNTDIISTNVTAGQTTVNFTNTPNTSDCWSWNVIGYYFQTTGCQTCASSLTTSIASQNPVCSQNTGWATVSVSGGNSPYTYAWNTSPPQSSATATGLGGGTYTCTVTDATGCATAILTATITQPSALAAPASSTNTSCGGASGSVSLAVSGGTPGYTYAWSPSAGSGATASNLSVGNYTVTVTDSHGCTVTSTASIANNPNPTVSSTIPTTNCPTSNQTITSVINSTAYADVTVCASNPSGYLTDNQTCTDPNNVNCSGHFQKDSLIAPYAIMGATLTAASVQSVYVSLDTIAGNNSRGCGLDNRLWLRSPGGTLYQLAAQKPANVINSTQSYNIPVANLVNCGSNCGSTGSWYNGCAGNAGFTWTDVGSSTPVSLSITFAVGVECTAGLKTISLNGFAQSPTFTDLSNCVCDGQDGTNFTLTWTPTNYNVGGLNTFLVTGLTNCFGFFPGVGGNYATVTATYQSTTNHYKPTYTVAGSLGILPNAVGSYNAVGYLPDQGSLSSAPWIGEVPGATWAGNANENYTHAAGQWVVYTNDQVTGSNPSNYTKITEFCIKFRTYPTPTYTWSVDPSSTAGCNSLLSSTTIPNPVFLSPASGSYNCTYTLVVTDGNGCTSSSSVTVGCSALPVSLLSFAGKSTILGNSLEWTTATETQNSHFSIQRSTDGYNFTELANVKSLAINGNSTDPLFYSFLDGNVVPGSYYYRLIQSDMNGDTKDCGTVLISVKSRSEILTVRPNPATNIAEVFYDCQTDETARLRLFDNKGILLTSQDISCSKGENHFTLSLSGYSEGIYLITLSTGGNVWKTHLAKSN